MQKTKSTQKRQQQEQEAAPVTPDEQALQESSDAMIEEIECCLAENEADTEKALKAAAEEEWQTAQNDDVLYSIWMAKYQHLFRFCCGRPYFGDD